MPLIIAGFSAGDKSKDNSMAPKEFYMAGISLNINAEIFTVSSGNQFDLKLVFFI